MLGKVLELENKHDRRSLFRKLLAIGVGALGAVGVGLARVKADGPCPLDPCVPLNLLGSEAASVLTSKNTSTSGGGMAIWAETAAPSGYAINGVANHSYGSNVGVRGVSKSTKTGEGASIGVLGQGGGYGLYGASGGVGTYALGTSGKSEFGGDILPHGDGSKDCGGPSNRWRNFYAGAIHTDVLYGTGNAAVGALSVTGQGKFGDDVFPAVDNKIDLGGANSRWATITGRLVYADYFYGAVVSRSLSKFKENIESPTDIDFLSAVPDPIYFNWKNSDDKKRHLGYVGDYLPDIAKTGEGYIESNSVTAILCGAVQQLKKENEELRRMIQKQ